jgi:hypothetical protein
MIALRLIMRTQWLLLPLLAAIAMRVAIPPGWMPAFTDQGVRLIWCSGIAAKRAAAATPSHYFGHGTTTASHHGPRGKADTDKQPSEHPDKSSGICTFAAVASTFAEAPAGLPLPVAIQAAVGWSFPIIVAVGRGLAAPPPPSTGPPALS